LRALQPALHPPGTALLRTLEGHSDWVNGVAVSPDGRRAVSASFDETLKVWDLHSAIRAFCNEIDRVHNGKDGRSPRGSKVQAGMQL